MKNYYAAEFLMIIDGKKHGTETVYGMGYDPAIVKAIVEKRVKDRNPGKTIASVLISKKDMDFDEYKDITGGNPPKLEGDQK